MKMMIMNEIVDEYEREKISDHHVEYDYLYQEDKFVFLYLSKIKFIILFNE
jgi:hypothetical protein